MLTFAQNAHMLIQRYQIQTQYGKTRMVLSIGPRSTKIKVSSYAHDIILTLPGLKTNKSPKVMNQNLVSLNNWLRMRFLSFSKDK